VECQQEIVGGRYSVDPPEFFCSERCRKKFYESAGIPEDYDLAWPDSSKGNYNPALAILRSGRPGSILKRSERVLRRIVLVRRFDDREDGEE
jgi:hypothetical protein